MKRSIAMMTALLLASCGGGQSGNEQAEGGKAAGSGGGGGAVAMEAGQWEITTQVGRMSVPNMPQGMSAPTPPATTIRTCLTEQQASAPSGGFFTGSGEAAGCTTENMSMANGRIQGTVQCSQQGTTMRSTMEGQFTPTSFELNQQVRTTAQGMEMEIESRTTGRRVGDCPA